MNNLDVDDAVSHMDENKEQINWRAARQAFAQLQKENQELKRERIRDPLEGYADHDVPTVADLRRLQQFESHRLNQEMTRNAEYFKENLVKTKFPDYDEVLNKYTKKAFEESPVLMEGIESASDKSLYAYQIGKMKQQLEATTASQQSPEKVERMIQNSQLPGNLSNCASYGESHSFDEAVWDMDDKEFEKFYRKQVGSPL